MAVPTTDERTGSGAGGSDGRPQARAARVVLWACLVGWLVLSLYLFFTPNPERLTSQVGPSVGHFFVFVAGGATASALVRRGVRPYLAIVGVGLFAGLWVEIAQEQLVTTRGFQAADLVADAAGLFLAAAVVGLIRRLVPLQRAVTAFFAAASSTALILASIVAAVGPDRLRHHLECWGAQPPDGEPVLAIDRESVHVGGDPAATIVLARQLDSLRNANGYDFDGGASAGLDEAPTITCALRRAGAFTVIAELEEVPLDQQGPARIVTLSKGWEWSEIDLHVGIVGDAVSVRLRTSAETIHSVEIPHVLDEAPFRLEVSFDGDVLSVCVDERLVYRRRLDADPYAWRQLPLTIGNEHGGERPLEGRVTELRVYAR